MRKSKKTLWILLSALLLLCLSVEVFTDGENVDEFRLVGPSTERWSESTLLNTDGFAVRQIGLFYQIHGQANSDGFRLLPPPVHPSPEAGKAEAGHWVYYE